MSVVAEKVVEAPSSRPASEPMLGVAPVPAAPAVSAQPASGLIAEFRARFRLHGPDDPAPASPRLFGLALWAATLGLLGLIPAGRLAAEIVFGAPWYPALGIGFGTLGIIAVAGAFASIHRSRLPWKLLGTASILLALNYLLIYTLL